MPKLELELFISWSIIDTDLSICNCCEDMIFSKINKPYFIVNNKKHFMNINICESCFELYIKTNESTSNNQ